MALSGKSELVKQLIGKEKEPRGEDVKERVDLIQALNYYSRNRTKQECKKYLVDFSKKHLPELHEKIKELSDYDCRSPGIIARLISSGMKLPGSDIEFIRKDVMVKIKNHKPKPVAPVVVKPKRIESPYNPCMDKIITEEDLICDGKKSPKSIFFEGTIAQKKEALTHAMLMLVEVVECKELYEKNALVEYKKFYKLIVDSLKDSVTPKARTPRPVDKNKIVKDVRFLEHDPVTNIKSKKPVDILGATQIIMYDAKRRHISHLVSLPGGFTVSGTTIKNIDEKVSMTKTLRKPIEFFANGIGIVTLVKKFKSVKTAPRKAVGRTNEDMLFITIKE